MQTLEGDLWKLEQDITEVQSLLSDKARSSRTGFFICAFLPPNGNNFMAGCVSLV